MSAPIADRYLTRRDLEAVLRRAAELEIEAGGAAPELSEADLLRIAREVGLSEESVRRALAEHRAAPGAGGWLSDRGWLVRLCGPSLVTASRGVGRPAADVREQVEAHFVRAEGLRLVRRTRDASLWEPDRSVVASLVRGLDLLGRGYELAKRARAIELRTLPIDERSSQVVLTADVGGARASWFWGLGVAAGVAAATGAAVFILGLPSAPDAAALGALTLLVLTVALARSGYRRGVERMRVVLDGLLDRLEHDEPLEPRRPSWRDLLR
jgi:hypothetical protein